jgi:hypothetical protein
MKNNLIKLLIIAGSILGIVSTNEMGLFANSYYITLISMSIFSTFLMHYFSKRNQPEVKIYPVKTPNLLSSLSVFLLGALTFHLFFKMANSINPMYGMISDYALINWPLSIIAFIFPSLYLGSSLWECDRNKSIKIIWFTSVLCGTYLYAGFVLSGIL